MERWPTQFSSRCDGSARISLSSAVRNEPAMVAL
jgi:hypothetical protein